ncbi:CGNR zinc finger domain-containing protein [Zhihengliuella alba]|uniref:CGNR zinc finger domain-containing protein n=1 Tax=Zhihengliuella alba TaxID=547018 RepID=A0ABP7CN38_9MICC
MDASPELTRPLPAAVGEDFHPAIALANTQEGPGQGASVDLLGTPEQTTRWMVTHGLAGDNAEVQHYCSNRLRVFRSSVLGVLDSVTSGRPPRDQDIEAINSALVLSPMASRLAWSADQLFHVAQEHPATRAVEHAMTLVAADLVELLTGPDAKTLARCADQGCGRFMLRTHARRQWCSTRCGDRVRAARAYAKKTSAGR